MATGELKRTPRAVYDRPGDHWSFLTQATDDAFEGQHFDRKEAGRQGATTDINRLRQLVTQTISAFANSNRDGGLLVIGIASDGRVTGTKHLSEQQKNSLTNLDQLLRNQATEAKFHDCTDHTGAKNAICLVLTPYADKNICEKQGRNAEAWERNGPQNVQMTQDRRDRLWRRKRLTDFENTVCCPYSRADVAEDVLAEFRKVFSPEVAASFSDDRLLREAGAVVEQDGKLCFTNAGMLFFALNPQRILSSAYIRLLRFGVSADHFDERGLPTFDKSFKGPITAQVREARAFFRQSGFFKRYQKRHSGGGFDEEPEFPPSVVDEAIVNAVAHRDYGTGLPIECEAYKDSFVVKNPGRMAQRNLDLPDEFSPADLRIDSMPTNPKLMEWLRLMRGPDGVAYVQAISEGTKQMVVQMRELGLPPPFYRLGTNETLLKLESNAESREAAMLAINMPKTEFGNLFPLRARVGERPASQKEIGQRYGELTRSLRDALEGNGWHIDQDGFSRILAHIRGSDLEEPDEVRPIVRLYSAFEFQFRQYREHFYLCMDYRCLALNVRRLSSLKDSLERGDLVGRRCTAKVGAWRTGRLVDYDDDLATVRLFDTESEETVSNSAVIPTCSVAMLQELLPKDSSFDLIGAIRRHSLIGEPGAARKRAERTTKMLNYVASSFFPIRCCDLEVDVLRDPVRLTEGTITTKDEWVVRRLPEPPVEFRQRQSASNVREGITRYGAYDDEPQQIDLVPVCLASMRRQMEALIARLSQGRLRYRGSERTFAAHLSYSGIACVERMEDLDEEISRLLEQRTKSWRDGHAKSIFLVHTPEQGYAQDDHMSPYYLAKRRLLEAGVPCQMVDTPTLQNPDWKDLNLALNICAKCGVRPWVLPDAIPDVDFFVGLAYTQSSDLRRIMGFSSVFNSYGRWEFYCGNTAYFDFGERHARIGGLVEETMTRLEHRMSTTPSIVFQYSAKLSKHDREAILRAARRVRPEGIYTFVWVNSRHNVRFYDSKPETDGSLRRGSYVEAGPNKVYLSTTGYNPFRRMMGTAKPLEVSAWVVAPNGDMAVPDLRTLAVQTLSLTKLNWASTDAFCGEPITLKYARDIAYLTAAFLRQSEPFVLHPDLEATPWFL